MVIPLDPDPSRLLRLTSSAKLLRIFYPKWAREDVIRAVQEGLPQLAARLPLARVVLFGSYARGAFTAASDIDLLVVYRGPSRPDAHATVRKTLKIPRLEPHLFTLEEAEAGCESIQRMERGGIVLFPPRPEDSQVGEKGEP